MKTMLLTIALAMSASLAIADDQAGPAGVAGQAPPAAHSKAQKDSTPVSGTPKVEPAKPAQAPQQAMPQRTVVQAGQVVRATQAINESIAHQNPTPGQSVTNKTHGFAPGLVRSIKLGNPLQLINPFAPMTKQEKERFGDPTRVSYDPKKEQPRGFDFFSVDF